MNQTEDGIKLRIDTLDLNRDGAQFPSNSRNMTPLPSPVNGTFNAASSGGRRTTDFFSSPFEASGSNSKARSSDPSLDLNPLRQRTVSNDSILTRSPLNRSYDVPKAISNLPSAIHTSPPRATKMQAAASGLGIGYSPKHTRSDSDPFVALHPPSRLPTAFISPSVSTQNISGRLTEDPFRSSSPTEADFEISTEPGTVLNDQYVVERKIGDGAFSQVVLAHRKRALLDPPPSPRSKRQKQEESDTIAIKIIDRKYCRENDRMRISVLREIEVLKHIHHPSLVHLIDSFSSEQHMCLVLEYAAGGELFNILSQHHSKFTDGFVTRIFTELADVVGWMHGIGLVHRDIKLENILLTVNPFSSDSLLPLPNLLVKLTDFGLSRFVDLARPTLQTRCGSEEYAAPELIMGQPYDGRKTDAWALGVVLYAILVGSLPFQQYSSLITSHDRADLSKSLGSSLSPPARSRKSYLMKIAKADFTWPSTDECPLATLPARQLVGRLLERDANARARLDDIWSMEFLTGAGTLSRRRSQIKRNKDGTRSRSVSRERRRQSIDGLPVRQPSPPSSRLFLSTSRRDEADDESSSEDDVVIVKPEPADPLLYSEHV